MLPDKCKIPFREEWVSASPFEGIKRCYDLSFSLFGGFLYDLRVYFDGFAKLKCYTNQLSYNSSARFQLTYSPHFGRMAGCCSRRSWIAQHMNNTNTHIERARDSFEPKTRWQHNNSECMKRGIWCERRKINDTTEARYKNALSSQKGDIWMKLLLSFSPACHTCIREHTKQFTFHSFSLSLLFRTLYSLHSLNSRYYRHFFRCRQTRAFSFFDKMYSHDVKSFFWTWQIDKHFVWSQCWLNCPRHRLYSECEYMLKHSFG